MNFAVVLGRKNKSLAPSLRGSCACLDEAAWCAENNPLDEKGRKIPTYCHRWTKEYFQQELVPPNSETTVSEILPSYDAATGSYSVPRDEPVFVSIDFETPCWFATGTYPENHPMNGLYKYNPITEICWTILDTRDFTKLKTPPGDRAFYIYIYIYSKP